MNTEVLVSIAKMSEHVCPGLVDSWLAGPESHVRIEDGLFHEECVGQIQFVLCGKGRLGMFREFFKICDGVEYIVDRHGQTIAHVAKSLFLGNYQLGGNTTMGRIEMVHDGGNTIGILQGGSVEQGTDVSGVDSLDDLRN